MGSFASQPWKGSREITGARLAAAVLGYFLAVIAIITLVPFRFEIPGRFALMMHGTTFDIVANILLFLPPGFLWRLVRPSERDRNGLDVLALGLGASVIIECTQLFEPARFASPLDVLANGSGAWAGALLCDRVASRIRPDSALVARLSLEIPLMGFVYLLVPLLWVGSLAAGDDGLRLSALLLPGLAGATVLAWVHRFRLGRLGTASSSAVATAAGFGMLVAVSPATPQHPLATLLLAALVAVAASLLSRLPLREPLHDRRFERRALRAAMPLLAAYFLALPWLTQWPGSVPPAVPPPPDATHILRMIERLAAFTVLGYLIAEWRGRIDPSAATALRSVGLRTLPWVLYGISVQWRPGGYAPLLWGPALLLAALFGAALYHLQRAHVRALIAASPLPLASPGSVLDLVSTTK